MRAKIIELLYKYRIDFSTAPNYTDFGIAEDKFDALADDLDALIDSAIEADKKRTDQESFDSED
jgi:hypothetical protein